MSSWNEYYPDEAFILHDACRLGDLQRVQELSRLPTFSVNQLEPDAELRVDWISDTASGYTPLHRACEGGHVEVVRFLLSKGAESNALCEGMQQTPLHVAASHGYYSEPHHLVVKVLLSEGNALPDLLDYEGNTAMHVVAERYRSTNTEMIRKTIRILIEGGADPTILNPDGKTAEQIISEKAQKKKKPCPVGLRNIIDNAY